VEQLDHLRQPDGPLPGVAAGAPGQQQQPGADALAARLPDVAADLGDQRDLRAQLFLEDGLDALQVLRDRAQDLQKRDDALDAQSACGRAGSRPR
jgi:hypothetical protein